MDRILIQLIDDFLNCFELISTDIDDDFQNFSNYSVFAKEYSRDFEIELIDNGKGDDTGIDGLGIIVNGLLVVDIEDIDNLLKSNGYLDVSYIFIQSTSSNNFDCGKMGEFSTGVKDFFSENPRLKRNEIIKNKAEISEYIFKNANHFKSEPHCILYYVTTGKWTGDQNNQAIIEMTKSDLINLNLFSNVEFVPLGETEICKYYRDSKNFITATINFSEKVTLPEIQGIVESYFGMITLNEFKKIILDEKGNLKNIFDDNVRDFQGFNNTINASIEQTLLDSNPDLFTVFNNGITIVARELKPSGNKFTINDYQIVNGCQTSNVLSKYSEKENLQQLRIPIRLIITNNDDVKNRITVATNSQTAIKREQLQSLKEFQKNLLHYYNSMSEFETLYYERRPGQYQGNSKILKSKIITIQSQIKAFGSMFYEIPHLVTTYYGKVLDQFVESEDQLIFNPNHKFLPYFISGLAYYRLESLFRKKEIDKKYQKFRWYIIMIFSKLANRDYKEGLKKSFLNSSKKTDNYCNPILAVLCDHEKYKRIFQESIKIIDISKIDLNDKQLLKASSLTDLLLKIVRANY